MKEEIINESREARKNDVELAEEFFYAKEKILREIKKVIVGQDEIIQLLLVTLFAKGHCLFIGVPGLAKTLLINTLSQCLNLKFSRIQFTPDLMPADITGSEVLEEDRTTGKRVFQFIKGPLFCNVLLADEVNRTPPKTQAALLQAMQEFTVTAGGVTYKLDLPFSVFATENPIEQEGTYPLPEAQLDRFMFSLNIDYPSFENEVEIIHKTTSPADYSLEKVLSPLEILKFQELVLRVPIGDFIVQNAVRIVRATRPQERASPKIVKEFVSWGAGTRAIQHLIIGAKTYALLSGRYYVSKEDIKSLVYSVLQHRIIINYHGEAERIKPQDIINEILKSNE